MQSTWNPVLSLDQVAAQLANWTDTALQKIPFCPDGNEASGGDQCPTPNNKKDPPQPFPGRTLFAIMDQGTAAAFRFPTAQLVNPAGNAVAPNVTSMSAALNSMKTNPDKITQYQDFSNTSPNAYPLTEVQYAMVPTCHLTAAKTQAITQFLNNAAGSAQLYGVQPGELPPFGGYMSLTDAQRAQTEAAARAVSSQTCTTPPPDHTVSGQTPPPAGGTGNNTPGGNNNGNGNGNGNSPSSGAGVPTGTSIGSTPGGSSPSAASTSAAGQQPVGLGSKSADSGGLASVMLPIALALGALFAIGGPLAYIAGTSGLAVPGGRRIRLRPGRSAATSGAGAAGGGGDGDGGGAASGGEGGEGGDPSAGGVDG
jgi:hypothetical protein